MMIGFAVGAIRMTLDFVFQEPRCGEPDNRPAITRHVHFMYFAIIAFLITTIAIVIISYLTKPSDRKVSNLCINLYIQYTFQILNFRFPLPCMGYRGTRSSASQYTFSAWA